MDLKQNLIESSSTGKKRSGWKASLTSLGIHGTLLGLILFMSAHVAHKIHAEEKPIRAYIEEHAAPPPPPPPPPPPAATNNAPSHPHKVTPKVEVKPVEHHFVQPTQTPKVIPKVITPVANTQEDTRDHDDQPETPAEDNSSKSSDPAGVAGGVQGGVAGGVVGGEVGGVKGGELGGVKGGELGGKLGGTPGGNGSSDAPAAPSGPLRVGGDVKAPTVTNRVQPKYTESARGARVAGVVILEAIINKQGEVEQVRVLKGLPMGLTEEAESAVRQWRFKPGTLNGQPVDVIFNLTVNFALEAQ